MFFFLFSFLDFYTSQWKPNKKSTFISKSLRCLKKIWSLCPKPPGQCSCPALPVQSSWCCCCCDDAWSPWTFTAVSWQSHLWLLSRPAPKFKSNFCSSSLADFQSTNAQCGARLEVFKWAKQSGMTHMQPRLLFSSPRRLGSRIKTARTDALTHTVLSRSSVISEASLRCLEVTTVIMDVKEEK